MSNEKRPSAIDTGRHAAAPFVGRFGSFEREVAAAIYVEACVARGDRWQAVGPREFGETLRDLAQGRTVDPAPSWARFVAHLGIYPDMRGLMDGGWFSMDEKQRVEPTAQFFEALAAATTAG